MIAPLFTRHTTDYIRLDKNFNVIAAKYKPPLFFVAMSFAGRNGRLFI
jgi:hypothetical protein